LHRQADENLTKALSALAKTFMLPAHNERQRAVEIGVIEAGISPVARTNDGHAVFGQPTHDPGQVGHRRKDRLHHDVER